MSLYYCKDCGTEFDTDETGTEEIDFSCCSDVEED